MMLELTRSEAEVLADVIRRALGDLRGEIYRTELAEMHAELKAREGVLKGVLDRLSAAEAGTPP